MNTRTDPVEAAEIWKARYVEACRAFKARELSEPIFRADLYVLGFRGHAIESEINLNYPFSPGKPYP